MQQEPARRFMPEEVEERRRGQEKARRTFAEFVKDGPSMADELIAESRAEAASEAGENDE